MIHCPSSLFSSSNTTLQIRTSGKLVCGKKAPSSHLINLPHCQESCPTRVQLQLLYCYSSIPLLLHHVTACYSTFTTTPCLQSFTVPVLLPLLHNAQPLFLLLFYLYYYYYTMLQPLSPLFFYHLSSFNKKLSSHYSPCFPVSHLTSLF